MILMNLLAGQEQRHRRRAQTCDTEGQGEEGTHSESSTDIYTLPRVKQAMGSCRITQGAELGAL